MGSIIGSANVKKIEKLKLDKGNWRGRRWVSRWRDWYI